MVEGKFATSVSCMDGRIQIPLNQWIKENFSADYVDTITEPGVDKNIANVAESIKTKIGISINAHKSELVVVSGHYDCAANPVSDEEHIIQIKNTVKVISSWNFNVKVVGVWIDNMWDIKTV